MCSLPLHVWAFILAFMDFPWVAERTNTWDALGVISYGLIFALIESVIVFWVTAIAGLLISTKWEEPRRVALLSALVLVLSGWAMYDQAHFMWGLSFPAGVLQYAAHSEHPVRVLYLFLLGPILLTVLTPVVLILQRDRAFTFAQGLIERFSFLAAFYLFFDAAGLVIVVIRNIQ